MFTAEAAFAEVREYAPMLARKKGLPADLLLLAVANLPVRVVAPEGYASSVADARRRIGRRNPDDVPTLALALKFRLPIWTNDKDFEGCGVSRYTSEDLLRHLGIVNRR